MAGSSDPDTVDAMAYLAEAREEVRQLKEAVFDEIFPADVRMLREWIPKMRKALEEIDAVLKVKTPTMDDRLQELLDNPEFDPKRWYLVTREEEPELAARMGGRQMPFVMTGDRVKEVLERDVNATWPVAHVYQIEDDGTLTMKR